MRIRTWVLLGLAAVVAVGAGVWFVYYNVPPPGKGGVTGRYWYQDDTGRRDSYAGEGSFLVVPGVTVPDLWPEMADSLAGPVFPDMSGDFDFDQLEKQYGATIVEVQPNSLFRVVSPPGPTVICLISLRGVAGCTELDLPEDGSLRAARGEFGFGVYIE